MVRGFGWCVGGGYFDYWGGLLIIYYYLNDLLPLNSGTLSSFLREYSYRHNLLYQTFISLYILHNNRSAFLTASYYFLNFHYKWMIQISLPTWLLNDF